MRLMNDETLMLIPVLFATRDEPDPVAVVRFFCNGVGPSGWYAIEFDGRDTFYGLVAHTDRPPARMGYFSLRELQRSTVNGGPVREPMPSCLTVPAEVRRDDSFEPMAVSKILANLAF